MRQSRPTPPISDHGGAIPAVALVALCRSCGAKPRACGGRLSRCLDCLKVDTDRDRQARQAAMAKHRQVRVHAGKKPCRTCKATKPVDEFGRHAHTKDGRRHDRTSCARAKRRALNT